MLYAEAFEGAGMKSAILLLALTVPVSAEDKPPPINCDDVRAVVQAVGKTEALRLARETGASEARIKLARRCLKETKMKG
jgi:hypothetical protein